MQKPISQASENNKQPILDVLKNAFAQTKKVLEIGSGTGQHAVFFAGNLPHLEWQPSDVEENLPGIKMWLDESALCNINPPKILDVNQLPWSQPAIDGIYTANTLHIMGKDEVANFFLGLKGVLKEGGKLCIYGPFNYQGAFTSESNARFQVWLEQQNPKSGIRDFEWISELAGSAGLELVEDHAMPANNRLLEWRKVDFGC